MLNLLRREKTRISREDSLNGVPQICAHITVEQIATGETLLIIPRRKTRGFMSRFPLPPIKLLLDDLGSLVFKMINGKNKVNFIVNRFARESKLHQREAEASVVSFLNMLMKRGVILIAVPHRKLKEDTD